MTLFSLLIIYIGSFKSVELLIREKISIKDFSQVSDKIETVGVKEASKFPIVGSGFLFGLYLAIKYFGKQIVNWLLLGFFVISGIDSVKELINTYATDSIKKQVDQLES